MVTSLDSDPLLTAQHLAEYLDIPVGTLYAWRKRGEGPQGFRVGRHLRYRWSDVQAWVSARIRDATRHPGMRYRQRGLS
jgi:excisionase family DNA binding protein